MKHFFFLLFLLGCLSACDKSEKTEVYINAEFSFSAVKNNSFWQTTSSWATYYPKDKRFVVVGVKRDPQFYQEEHLILSFYLTDISKSDYSSQLDSKWDFIIGGDGVADTYLNDSTFHHLLIITSIDTTAKKISGIFTTKLIRDKFRSDKGETFLFKDGEFNLNYRDVE